MNLIIWGVWAERLASKSRRAVLWVMDREGSDLDVSLGSIPGCLPVNSRTVTKFRFSQEDFFLYGT